MAYCSIEELLKRIPEKVLISITQDDKNHTQVNSDRIDAAIFDSDALIDGKLGGLYVTPLTPIPPRIVRIAVDLTMYFLYKARYDNKVPESVSESYKDAVSYLDKLRAGEETINAETNEGYNEFVILTNISDSTNRYYSNETLSTI